VLLAAIFGAADQYVGSLPGHPWLIDVSLLSAPWLAIAFLGGRTQHSPWRAAAIGLACTAAALAGYTLMTLSPVEGAQLTTRSLIGFARSSHSVLLGGVVTGPLFGWFGQQWRVRRARAGALVTALAICLEPFARMPAHREIRSHAVAAAEVAAGLLAVLYVVLRAQPDRRGSVGS
jgi:hypothetical protein